MTDLAELAGLLGLATVEAPYWVPFHSSSGAQAEATAYSFEPQSQDKLHKCHFADNFFGIKQEREREIDERVAICWFTVYSSSAHNGWS